MIVVVCALREDRSALPDILIRHNVSSDLNICL